MLEFFIECCGCGAVSPLVQTTVPPPSGWTEHVEGKEGRPSTTTWTCPTCVK